MTDEELEYEERRTRFYQFMVPTVSILVYAFIPNKFISFLGVVILYTIAVAPFFTDN